MKKRILIATILCIAIITLFFLYSRTDSDIITHLNGKIYYTKRVGRTLELYTANANLTNNKLIYTHKGEENNNIIDFYYDKETDLIYFVAMKNKEWSLFSIDEKERIPQYIKSFNAGEHWKDFLKYYVQSEYKKMNLIDKEGSLYLVKDGEEQLLKKFIGIYDSKFNSGYQPIGFSPDGRYILYHSSEHLTPVGTLIEGFLDRDYSIGQNYIMDLETRKSEKYPEFNSLQWIID